MYDEPETEGCPVYKALLDSGVTISNDWLCPECQRVHEAILNDKKPEVPEVIKDLMVGLSYPETTLTMKQGDFDMRVLEAYRRGKDNPIK